MSRRSRSCSAARTSARRRATARQPRSASGSAPSTAGSCRRRRAAPGGFARSRSMETCRARCETSFRTSARLHRRQASRGLEVAVVLPPEAAAKLAANAPHLVIATADRDLSYYEGRVFVTAADGRSRLELSDPDGLIDAFEALVSEDAGHERMSAPFTQIFELLWNLQTPNGGERLPKAGEVDQLLPLLPRCGRARALDVLRHCWRSSESPEAARRAWRDGLGASPTRRRPDDVLRPRPARRPPRPVRQASGGGDGARRGSRPDDPFTQLVYHALLHAGQARVADQLAARLPALLGADPALNLSFAETLMEARQPERYEPAAAAAIARAAAKGAAFGHTRPPQAADASRARRRGGRAGATSPTRSPPWD